LDHLFPGYIKNNNICAFKLATFNIVKLPICILGNLVVFVFLCYFTFKNRFTHSFGLPVWSVMGSLEHPLSSLSVEGSVRVDGESFKGITRDQLVVMKGTAGGPGGGSGGTILLFLHTLDLGEHAVLSSVGGYGRPTGGGGGGGGRVHFHWSDIPTGDMYQPIARVNGSIHTWFVFYMIYLDTAFSGGAR